MKCLLAQLNIVRAQLRREGREPSFRKRAFRVGHSWVVGTVRSSQHLEDSRRWGGLKSALNTEGHQSQQVDVPLYIQTASRFIEPLEF